MKSWLKHLFVHDWDMELEYLSPRTYKEGCWIVYNRLMSCNSCGKMKHYSTKIADCGRMSIAQCESYMEIIKEKMKENGFFKMKDNKDRI